jgi:hypothetical protein
MGAGPRSNIAEGPSALNPGVGQGRIFTAAGRAVDVDHQVVEAGSLTASHFDDLRRNPAYPRELQPRERARAASEAQVAEIAGKLEPERLGGGTDAATGAPIVGADNVIESGNGLVLALRRAYAAKSSRAEAYRAWLAAPFRFGAFRWLLIFPLRLEPCTGSRRQRYATFKGTKRCAQTELGRRIAEEADGLAVEPSKITVAEYLARWLSDAAKPRVAARTFEQYSELVEKHLTPGLGSFKLAKLRPAEIHNPTTLRRSPAGTLGARAAYRLGPSITCTESFPRRFGRPSAGS